MQPTHCCRKVLLNLPQIFFYFLQKFCRFLHWEQPSKIDTWRHTASEIGFSTYRSWPAAIDRIVLHKLIYNPILLGPYTARTRVRHFMAVAKLNMLVSTVWPTLQVASGQVCAPVTGWCPPVPISQHKEWERGGEESEWGREMKEWGGDGGGKENRWGWVGVASAAAAYANIQIPSKPQFPYPGPRRFAPAL